MLVPPRFLFIQSNDRCNLRCEHCHNWQLESDQFFISPERRAEIIAEFAELAPGAAVVICGGESMLDLVGYYSICRQCRELGLRSLSVVNGTMIQDSREALRMLVEGPDEVAVSLDSHVEADHDRVRGVVGAYRAAVRSLRLLLQVRAGLSCDRKIRVRMLLFNCNYQDLEAMHEFVLKDVGADAMRINILQPTFNCSSTDHDHFFNNHSSMDEGLLVTALRACDVKYHLGLNPRWIELVGMYVRSISRLPDGSRVWRKVKTEEAICNSGDRNIMVDLKGDARLCFSHKYPSFRLRAHGDLRLFWESADPIRQDMRGCRYACGIADCTRRESFTTNNDRLFEGGGS